MISGWSAAARAEQYEEGLRATGMPRPTADAVIVVWLPGGISCGEYFDARPFTPFQAGMKASEMLGVCPPIPTTVDGVQFGTGLERMAQIMHLGTLVRSLSTNENFSFDHTRQQFHLLTGYAFPAGFKAPSLGSVISRVLGRRHPAVPGYIDIGRETLESFGQGPAAREFVNEFHGPGFYGVKFAPFVVDDPRKPLETLSAARGMSEAQVDRRLEYFRNVTGLAPESLRDSPRHEEYLAVMQSAREMMDSPAREAFAFREHESEETLNRYRVAGTSFGQSCLVARRLIERGARFVKVNYPFQPFNLIDTHRMSPEMNTVPKSQIDKPLAALVRDLEERGLLDRTLVVVMSEFGRTLAGKDGVRVSASNDDLRISWMKGEDMTVDTVEQYGFHGHFPLRNNVLFFGGGFKRGFAYGRAADRHPMVAIENVVSISDVHASIYQALGIASDVYYLSEGRPVRVTKDGKGTPIDALFV